MAVAHEFAAYSAAFRFPPNASWQHSTRHWWVKPGITQEKT
jgi:hypothetical protein